MTPPGNESEAAFLQGELRTVAFVDILGFSEAVRAAGRQTELFPRLVEALQGGFEGADRLSDETNLLDLMVSQIGGEKFETNLEFSFFSDCAYISARSAPGGTDRVLGIVLHYARNLMRHGYFVRGGIARGLAAHRGGIVVGPAVLEAYTLEQKAAIFPRIVLADAVAEELRAIASQTNPTATLRRGQDGVYFLDILSTLALSEDGEADLRLAGSLIRDRLDQSRPLDIEAKWRWLAAQYNRAICLVGSQGREKLMPISRLDIPRIPEEA